MIRLLNEHALTSPGLTGSWEQRLGKIERGEDSRKQFMSDIAGFAEETVKELDETLKDVRIPRARAGPVPGVRPRDRREPQGLLLLGARGSRLRIRDLEGQSRQAAAARGCARADQDRLHRAAGDRLPRAQRAQLPRAPGDEPDRGGQMAGRVRRAVGARRAPSRPRPRPRAPPRRSRRSLDRRRARAPNRPARPDGRPRPRASASGACRGRARGWAQMPITLITGPANAGKAQLVLEAVRREIGARRGAAAGRAHARGRRALPARARRARARRWASACSASRG